MAKWQTMKFSSLQRENRINKPTRPEPWETGQQEKKKPILGIFIRPLEDEVHLFGGLLFIYLLIIARSHFDSPITISFRKLEHSNMPKIALSQTLFA